MSWKSFHISSFFLLLLSFLFAANLPAQQAAIISGTVTDELGEPLPGVSVELKGAVPLKPETIYTDSNGNYVFRNASPGNYQLVFRLFNFVTVVKSMAVTSDTSIGLDVAMHLTLDAEVVVTGKDSFRNLAERTDSLDNLIGVADAASVGVVTGQQVDQRPFLRAGEVLETVPGVVISQHSGQGKANQYYLRGFNLDHGTDFSISVNDIPVNMPTHGHGQGYADINFLIPELISVVQYKKGPYDAEEGDFAAAGATHISYANSLPDYLAQATGGNFTHGRALLAGSPKIGSGYLLYGFEYSYDDGPWDNGDNFRKLNGVLRYSRLFGQSAFSITGMGYEGKWDSTDQIPLRAVENGEIGRFGNVDPTDGGKTHRYSLSTEWERNWNKSVTRVSAYVMDYKLNLWSNFTYFLDDQVNGDQFEQADDRTVFGGKITHRFLNKLGNFDTENVVGLQFRKDDITGVGLFHTKARERLSTTRQDDVIETGRRL